MIIHKSPTISLTLTSEEYQMYQDESGMRPKKNMDAGLLVSNDVGLIHPYNMNEIDDQNIDPMSSILMEDELKLRKARKGFEHDLKKDLLQKKNKEYNQDAEPESSKKDDRKLGKLGDDKILETILEQNQGLEQLRNQVDAKKIMDLGAGKEVPILFKFGLLALLLLFICLFGNH